MKPSKVAVLASVVWYLMRPPLPHLSVSAIHTDRTLSRWIIVKAFPTQKECETRGLSKWERCVASNDPRL
jgi:hypothetical protein